MFPPYASTLSAARATLSVSRAARQQPLPGRLSLEDIGGLGLAALHIQGAGCRSKPLEVHRLRRCPSVAPMSDHDPAGLGSVLRAARRSHPADVPALAAAVAATMGGSDVVVYLADFGQVMLVPLLDWAGHGVALSPEPVAGSVAGRAFTQQHAVTAERGKGIRVWAPVVEGSDVTGVVAVTVADDDRDTVEACEDLGMLIGYMVATESRVTDAYNLHRRRQGMSLAASMQWDILPPLGLAAPHIQAAGLVEPAYAVGGDCFDYAVNGPSFDFCIMDCVGHGTSSSVTAALALGCYRHGRRLRHPLARMHEELDEALRLQFVGEQFVTGQLAHLELQTGTLTWLNAGHPLPLLLRGGRVVGALECPPALPWGLGPSTPAEAVVSLEPGDSLLFYTDGVVEARGPNRTDFGTERLADLAGKYASDQLPPRMIVRLLVQAVLEHHQGTLSDDATMLLAQWTGP